jgi:hypothetical protein
VYISLALVAIGTAGSILSDEDATTQQIAFKSVAVLGAGLTTLAAKSLYNASSFLSSIMIQHARAGHQG